MSRMIDRNAPSLVERVDALRRAESQFARRLAAVRAPNDTDREAMRFIAGASEESPATPGGLAAHLGVSTAAVTSVLRRLLVRGQIEVAAHPADARSKLLRATVPEGDAEIDELSVRIDRIAADFAPDEIEAIARFLGSLAEEIADLPGESSPRNSI